jgi:hypothetical protein
MREVLEIRSSSRLFRLRTGADIKSRVRFHNTGASALPGLIVMSISDATGNVDRQHTLAAVVFNANDAPQALAVPALAGESLLLHPVFASSADPVVRTATFAPATGQFSVPARTAAVFWEVRSFGQQLGFLVADVNALVASGALSKGEGKSLIAKLNAAIDQANRGNTTAAANQLNAFINELRALLSSGRLPAVQAEALIREAQAIMATF